jgi:hypothetical protein
MVRDPVRARGLTSSSYTYSVLHVDRRGRAAVALLFGSTNRIGAVVQLMDVAVHKCRPRL